MPGCLSETCPNHDISGFLSFVWLVGTLYNLRIKTRSFDCRACHQSCLSPGDLELYLGSGWGMVSPPQTNHADISASAEKHPPITKLWPWWIRCPAFEGVPTPLLPQLTACTDDSLYTPSMTFLSSGREISMFMWFRLSAALFSLSVMSLFLFKFFGIKSESKWDGLTCTFLTVGPYESIEQ